MSKKNQESMDSELFKLDGRPALGKAIPLALQHVVAMIVGCVTPAIIVSGSAGLSDADSVTLLQAALIVAALSTLLQLFPIFKGKSMAIGSGLPVIMGISFAYVPSMQAIAEGFDVATILGAQIFGGVIAALVGLNIKAIRKFFPPLITGTVVFAIGLSLYPTAINYMAGGTGKPDYGSWQNWAISLITLAVVIALNHFGKGIVKLASILIGIIVGYIIALFAGMVDFTPVASAALFQIPMPLHFGIKFEISSCAAIGVLFAINSIQAIGDFSATTTGSMDRMPTDTELKGGIFGYGISNILGALLGGLPTATFSQNVGIVVTTKVVSRVVLGLSAAILLIAGILPKFSSLLTTIPSCVLGGATVSVFATIAITGIKLITQKPLTFRSTTIVGLSIAMGMGVTQASASLAQFPEWVTMIFGKSPVVLATICAVLLNLILPKDKEN